MYRVNKYYTATNADALSGTEFDPPPISGTMYVWATSDNDTATIGLPQAGQKSGILSFIPNIDSNASMLKSKIIPFKVPVKANEKIVIQIAGTVSKVWLSCVLVGQAYGKKETLFYQYKSATSTDVFSGTLLDPPEYDGTLYIYPSADVVTSTLEVVYGGHKMGRTDLAQYTNADASPDVINTNPIVVPVKSGVKPVVVLGGAVTEAFIIGHLVG